ncbi:hypothetical protein GEV893_20780 [Xanthomonas perforans]|nr:hypothetical protein XP816_02615 [Xanthomonas perforans]KLC26678.1 hypothetical protein XP95_22965 [Xanthomonas perforans]KLC53632.1 hypothetical protein XP1815_03145 [Xanthomonas perforans]KLC55483.1 hypothetical protein XP2010_12215 [Xanthomonas perforans]KLC59788.1 hypothetical protein GEV872_16775 [Xanthomonas perforans]
MTSQPPGNFALSISSDSHGSTATIIRPSVTKSILISGKAIRTAIAETATTEMTAFNQLMEISLFRQDMVFGLQV